MDKIILVSGLKQSGKNYSSRILKNLFTESGELAVEKSFAYFMKYMLSTTMGVSMGTFERLKEDEIPIFDGDIKEINTDARGMLQRFGTDVMYPMFGETIWADLAVKDLNKTVQGGIVIYTDFRHTHEYDAIMAEFGSCITIRVEDGRVPSSNDHDSERNLTDAGFQFDYTIDNSAKDDSIITKVQEIFKDIKDGK